MSNNNENSLPEKNKANKLAGSKNPKKQKLSIMEEERIFSPGRTAFNNFISRKLSMLGMVMFLLIFAGCMFIPLFIKMDILYTDILMQNIAPGFNMMSYPKELDKNSRMIGPGPYFGVGIDNNGKLYQWGKLTDRLKTTPDNMGNLVMVSAGHDHAIAANDEGNIYAWGNNRLNITNIPPEAQGRNIVQLEAGYQISAVLDDEGNMFFWGNQNLMSISTSGIQGNIQKFALNTSTGIVLLKDGSIAAMTNKPTPFINIPEHIQGRAVDIASTDKAAAALLNNGTIVVWGDLFDYGIADVPEEIQGKAVAIDGGRNHFTALLDDGTVAAWGDGYLGQTNVPDISNIEKVYSSYHQNYAIDSEGKIHSWGLKGYLMGTDQHGRDVAKRLVLGGRVSLTIGSISVIIMSFIGILVGGFAGFYGGKADMILMRMAEVVQSIPLLPLALILSAIIGNKVSETGRVAMIMVIIGILGWPSLARLTRGTILAERENEFVTAAKSMGIKEGVIIFRHILPNILGVILVTITLSLASSILTESTLSFLNFGIREPTPTWGNMLTSCTDSNVILNFWWRWVFPSIILGLSTISINIMGDGIRDAIDPKSHDR